MTRSFNDQPHILYLGAYWTRVLTTQRCQPPISISKFCSPPLCQFHKEGHPCTTTWNSKWLGWKLGQQTSSLLWTCGRQTRAVELHWMQRWLLKHQCNDQTLLDGSNRTRSHVLLSANTTPLLVIIPSRACSKTSLLVAYSGSLQCLSSLPSPMYEKSPTLRWGQVQTRKRRECQCPQYRVFGSLRFRQCYEPWTLHTFQ